MCIGVYLHVFLCIMYVHCLQQPEEDIRFPGPELLTAVSHHMGLEPGSMGRAASALAC